MVEHDVAFQVCVLGARAGGKSSFIEAALAEDPALVRVGGLAPDDEPAEEVDGLALHRAVYELPSGTRCLVELLEFPPDERYLAILPSFGASCACAVVVADVSDPAGLSDLEERVSALRSLGAPPHGGFLVANKAGEPGCAEERRQLERLRELAEQWSLRVVRFETLEHMRRAQLLHSICSLVVRDVPNCADPLHLLGSRVTKGPGRAARGVGVA